MNHIVLFKNAIANVLRGGAAALVLVVMPPFLARTLSTETYGIWILVLQLGAYVGYLDFGIQTALGRFVAHATELKDKDQRDRIVSTSLAILTGSALLGFLIILILTWQLPNLFHKISPTMSKNAQLLLLLVGGSLAIGLPFSVFNGVFIGLQRNELPAITIGGGKIASAILVILLAWMSGNIIYMGIGLAAANLVIYGVQFWSYTILVKDSRISRLLISKQSGKEIFSYCFSLSIWSFATLLVLGFDTTIVGFFDFGSVAYYSVAASLITFILGVQSAFFSVLIPAAAVLEAQGNAKELGKLLITTTRYSIFLLLLTGLPLVIFAGDILSLWVGPLYGVKSAVLLQILVIANIVRLSALPYAMLLIGTGQQRLIIISPLVEGASNLISSIIGASLLGAIGVALGTVTGSSIGVALNLVYNMPRTKSIAVGRGIYIIKGILYPLLCMMPLVGVSLLTLFHFQLTFNHIIILTCGAVVLSTLLVWRWGLEKTERLMFISLVNSRFVNSNQGLLRRIL